jgi:GT2 family glycosyltransferase
VIGAAGNRRRRPGQPSWCIVDMQGTPEDSANFTGRIAHAAHPFGAVSFLGKVPGDCELLDGVFLAARKSLLTERGVGFDPRFEFHFYDMDFCRSARLRGLRLGTWPICLTHQSEGTFWGEQWTENYRAYLAKWKE